jgi:hypothetical protein
VPVLTSTMVLSRMRVDFAGQSAVTSAPNAGSDPCCSPYLVQNGRILLGELTGGHSLTGAIAPIQITCLFSQKRASRKQRNEIMSSGSLNHVQYVQLATLSESSADGGEPRGTC